MKYYKIVFLVLVWVVGVNETVKGQESVITKLSPTQMYIPPNGNNQVLFKVAASITNSEMPISAKVDINGIAHNLFLNYNESNASKKVYDALISIPIGIQQRYMFGVEIQKSNQPFPIFRFTTPSMFCISSASASQVFIDHVNPHSQCSIYTPKNGTMVFNAGCHHLAGLTGIDFIESDIQINPGATVILEASSHITFRQNIRINGGKLLVKAPRVVFNDESGISKNVELDNGGELKVYANQYLYFTANLKNSRSRVHLEGSDIRMEPYNTYYINMEGYNDAVFTFLFCNNMTILRNANIHLKDRSYLIIKGRKSKKSTFITQSVWIAENPARVEVSAGLVEQTGQWVLHGSEFLVSFFDKMRQVPNFDSGNHEKAIIDMAAESMGRVWFHHKTVEDEPCSITNPNLSCQQSTNGESERQFLKKEESLIEGKKETSIEDIQIYPNPSSDVVNIAFKLEEAGDVKVEILDAMGRKVWEHEAKKQEIGTQKITWQGKNAQRGLYFVHILANSKKEVRKVILIE